MKAPTYVIRRPTHIYKQYEWAVMHSNGYVAWTNDPHEATEYITLSAASYDLTYIVKDRTAIVMQN